MLRLSSPRAATLAWAVLAGLSLTAWADAPGSARATWPSVDLRGYDILVVEDFTVPAGDSGATPLVEEMKQAGERIAEDLVTTLKHGAFRRVTRDPQEAGSWAVALRGKIVTYDPGKRPGRARLGLEVRLVNLDSGEEIVRFDVLRVADRIRPGDARAALRGNDLEFLQAAVATDLAVYLHRCRRDGRDTTRPDAHSSNPRE